MSCFTSVSLTNGLQKDTAGAAMPAVTLFSCGYSMAIGVSDDPEEHDDKHTFSRVEFIVESLISSCSYNRLPGLTPELP